MSNHIKIRNLKSIKQLDFVIPNPGVHVLTAINGCGKTTLITCMARLSNNRAFNENFIQHKSPNVDSYIESRIQYISNNNHSTTYKYYNASKQWRPESNNAQALSNFGYAETMVIPTLGQRVYVQNQEISGGRRLLPASVELRNEMSAVLENTKFNDLKKVNLGETRGRGGTNRRNNTAFVLPEGYQIINGHRRYFFYSESNFSLGEIFILNLLFRVGEIRNNSLLVIDELEVALHPRVQVNLLNYLKRKAEQKNLTIIISTHSSTLIKCAPSLIFLNKDNNGIVKVNYNCYPTLALQEVAVEEDIQPDYVFFVEDMSAEFLLKAMLNKYLSISNQNSFPLYKVLPIGGYPEVLRFTTKVNQYLLHRNIGQFAFLDHDVLDVFTQLRRKGNNRTEAENDLFTLFNDLSNRLKYLPITPELGVWNWISNNSNDLTVSLRAIFPDSTFDIISDLRATNNHFPNAAQNLREEAKNKLSYFMDLLSNRTHEDKKRIKQHIFSIYVDNIYNENPERGNLMQLFGPIF